METAQRLVDEAAKSWGAYYENGKPLKFSHGTKNKDFTVFQKGDIGFHFGTKEQSKTKAGYITPEKTANPFFLDEDGEVKTDRIIDAYLKMDNPLTFSRDLGEWTVPQMVWYFEALLNNESKIEIEKYDRATQTIEYDKVDPRIEKEDYPMERIIYRKTLDVHKNGVQFTLQGFQTADNMSRTLQLSLMASGDTIDLPLEQLMAVMYVTTPNATEPSINDCTIKDNAIVCDILPIVEEGITEIQIMSPNVEYRTTERYYGSPVYVKKFFYYSPERYFTVDLPEGFAGCAGVEGYYGRGGATGDGNILCQATIECDINNAQLWVDLQSSPTTPLWAEINVKYTKR